MPAPVQRKLTTILAADAEGYSRLMEADEVATLGALRAAREVFSRFIERHHGRIANTAGDGLIADFPSVVEAVQCAIEVQRELGALGGDDANGALRFRIGIHLGDVIVDGGDLLGEGVNLAARLQTMAGPGEVLISQQVYDQVHSKLAVWFDFIGDRRPKNYAHDVPVYRVAGNAVQRRPAASRPVPAAAPARRDAPSEPAGGRWARVNRRARLFAVLWGGLVLINLGSGAPFWAFWPGLALAVALGLEAAPLVARRSLGPHEVRAAVILAALGLINLVTWSGYAWSLWPLGVAVALFILRRVATSAR